LAEMRSTLEDEIRQVKAEPLFAEQLQELSNLAFSAESLADVANALGLTVEQSAVFTREQGDGITSNTDVRQMAFSDSVLLDKEISAVVELNDSALVMAIDSHQEAVVRPLDEVRSQVVAALRRDRALELARSRAEAIVAGNESGDNWKTVTTTFAQASAAPRQAQQRAFSLQPGETDMVGSAGGFAVVTLEAINAKNWQEVAVTEQLIEAGRAQNSRADMLSYQTWARAVSDIEN